jgi:hypothetical protein
VLWVATLVDLFRRANMSPVSRVIWVVLIILFPVIGVFIYFLAPCERDNPLPGRPCPGVTKSLQPGCANRRQPIAAEGSDFTEGSPASRATR